MSSSTHNRPVVDIEGQRYVLVKEAEYLKMVELEEGLPDPSINPITALRKSKGMFKVEVARRMGITSTGYWHFENDPTRGFSLSSVAKLAQALGVTPEYLSVRLSRHREYMNLKELQVKDEQL